MRTFTCFLTLAVGLAGLVHSNRAFAQAPTPVKLLPTAGVDALFGMSVAASDSWLLIGAPEDTNTAVNPPVTGAGAVHVLDAVKRTPTRRLFATPSITNLSFGAAVAVDGDVAAVGAPNYNSGGNGSVYLFNAKTGAQLQHLLAPVSADMGYFGGAVAISTRWLVVGESASAKVWVYDRTNLTQAPVPLDSLSTNPFSRFGATLAISGDLLVVGSPSEARALLYDLRSLAVSDEPLAILAGDIGVGSEFGTSVAISGRYVVVGAPTNASPVVAGPGSVYVFDSITGQRFYKIDPPQDIGNQGFGKSVAFQGHLLLVGQGRSIIGNVHSYELSRGDYIETYTTTDPNTVDYGWSLAVNRRGTILIGVPFDNETSAFGGSSGAVFMLHAIPQRIPGDILTRVGGTLAEPANAKFSKAASLQLNRDGFFMVQGTVSGVPRGQTGVLWNTVNFTGTLGVLQQTGVPPVSVPTVSAIKSPIMLLPATTVWQATFTGPAAQNAGVLRDRNGSQAVLARKGEIPNNAYFAIQPNAFVKSFGAMASSASNSEAFVSVLSKVNAPATRDSHLLAYNLNTDTLAGALNEGNGVPGIGVTITPGQMPTRVAAVTNVALVSVPVLGEPSASNAGLFKFAPESNFIFTVARKGQPIDANPGAPTFRSFVGETIQDYSGGQITLFRASLTGGSASQNEGLWAEDGSGALTLLARKGTTTNQTPASGAPLLPATAKLTRVLRYWMLRSGEAVVLAQFSGPGITGSNNTLLYRVSIGGNETLMLRSGSLAPDCGTAKIGTISRVEVNPDTGDYIALTTLSGAESSANQALWAGRSSLFDSTPRLLLRKGALLRVDGVDLAVTSVSLVLPQSTTGAGGGGQPSCLGAETIAVQVSLANRTTHVARLRARPPLVN